MRTKHKLAIFATALACALTVNIAQAQTEAAEPILKSVTLKQPELDDFALGKLLSIESVTGKAELNIAPSNLHFGLEFYRAGERVEVSDLSAGFGGPKPSTFPPIEFTLQMVDMDNLQLAKGKPNHWRMNLYLGLNHDGQQPARHKAGCIPFDVSKETFRSVVSHGRFPLNAGDSEKAPLFWLASPTDKTFRLNGPVENVSKLLENNKSASFIIGYLYFTPPKR